MSAVLPRHRGRHLRRREGNPADRQRALAHLTGLEQAGHRFAVSDLTRTECLVPLLGPGGGPRLADYSRFFHGPNLRTVPLTPASYTRAAAIRGGHTDPAVPPATPKRYGLADALHLAAAIEAGCDVFLTNDAQLSSFPDIAVEVLP
ncbi:MAG: PIN domain-containing protein [Gemmataceae bacterium]|nr:PIN domain-containing protein [Gemmataceae bacterium]